MLSLAINVKFQYYVDDSTAPIDPECRTQSPQPATSYAQLSMRYTEGLLSDLAAEACRHAGATCRKPKTREEYALAARALRDAMKRLSGSGVVELASRAFVVPPLDVEARRRAAEGYLASAANYFELLAAGAAREDARFVLPQATKTILYFAMNARELITSFLPLRMCTRAQWEIRRLAWRVYELLNDVHPQLFLYAGPRCVLTENALRDWPVPLQQLVRYGFTIPRCPELVPRNGIPKCIRHAMTGSRRRG